MSDAASAPREEDVQLLRDTMQAAQTGDIARAFVLADRALSSGLTHPLFFKLRGAQRQQQGRLEEAAADFAAALADAPGDFAALDMLALCQARLGRLAEALRNLDAALSLAPDYAPAIMNRGWVLENLGDMAGARAAYVKVLELDPQRPRARAALAVLDARAGRWAEARAAAEEVLRREPGDPGGRLAQAMAALGEGDAAGAEQGARALLETADLPAEQRAVVLTLLGDAVDRQDRAAEAFAAYEQANAALEAHHAGLRSGAAGLALVERLNRGFAQTTPDDWRRGTGAAPAGAADGHAFIVGFPRSGTTLLGQVLDAHPLVTTLDEAETLAEPAAAFFNDEAGLARLAAAGPAELEAFRQAYWRGIAARGAEVAGRTFVDKLPMNTLGLPLIARLFPEAKVVFVQRDPRDVVLSCFRRQFVMSGATFEFLTLAGAARFYDAVMRLARAYMAGLDLDLTVLRYEDLVAEFPRRSAELCAFLGLTADPAVTGFSGAARAAEIATPSAAQVAAAPHGEGVGQWRRYAAQLQPVMPVLAPWVDAFGY